MQDKASTHQGACGADFQPLNDILGSSPVRVHPLAGIAAVARRRSSLQPVGESLCVGASKEAAQHIAPSAGCFFPDATCTLSRGTVHEHGSCMHRSAKAAAAGNMCMCRPRGVLPGAAGCIWEPSLGRTLRLLRLCQPGGQGGGGPGPRQPACPGRTSAWGLCRHPGGMPPALSRK